jgi:A/G-specific adenine glycosylase
MTNVSKHFAARIIAWQRHSGRHDLPWQGSRDPYRIWLSEIMLQQTQVATVIPYFERFVARFPSLVHLAEAAEDEVLALWSGLGYYARARNLHRAAREIRDQHAGQFPRDAQAIGQLPGIGRSTAGAIAVFAFGAREAILDGNVKRVLTRYLGIDGFPGSRPVEERLWAYTEALLPAKDYEAYTQGMMDLGATVCVRGQAKCEVCPLNEDCVARRENRVAALPSPRPRKARPEKSTVMLILRHREEILLEKRPAPGIWGGLWSFPEIARKQDAGESMLRQFGARTRVESVLAPLRHGFTHFSLTITPVILDVTDLELRAHSNAHQWLTVAEALNAGVPAPVRAILRELPRKGSA